MTGVIIASVILFFFPLATYVHGMQGTYDLYITGMKYMIDPPVIVNFWLTFPMLFLVVCSIILVATAIVLYKKRGIQLWLVNITFLLHVILILLIYFYYINHFEHQFGTLPSYKIGVFFPLASLVCLILASKAIRKDEALVRSSDRLR
jgi:glucan phosphoethanolaminetransferase (alkaline phosphatase superfamily)